ncbi:branched-chain amino acid ABC transporter permease [Streptomyces sp. NPDC096132]|uniref:branched-chain amino acid ABC transporter permease n=1 Tax=Streptomyces sp. NPDC096132 TaxID=3366075 RepID=UPI00381EA5D5
MSSFLAYLVSGIALGCTFALVASGFVMIHRVTGVVNFAQGTFAVVGGMAAAQLLGDGLPHGVAEAVALVAAGALGLLIGVIAIGKPGTPPLTSVIITLGLAIGAYAAEVVIFGDQPLSFTMADGAADFLGAHVQWQRFVIIGVTVVSYAVLALFFGRTYVGKALTACSSNPYAARLSGIDPTRMGLLAFTIGGLLGGLAGILITPVQPLSFDSDALLAVNGFAAAVFGGLMRPWTALLGALVLGVSESMVGGYINASYEIEVALALMLAIMVWRSARTPAMAEEAV